VAVLARTQALLDERGVAACERELALCDLFCVEAGRRFRTQRIALDGREDEVDDTRRAAAAAVRKAAGYWVTDAILDETPRPASRFEGTDRLTGDEAATGGARAVGAN
jgi:acyl-CoA dehydrogenase family protein 9